MKTPSQKKREKERNPQLLAKTLIFSSRINTYRQKRKKLLSNSTPGHVAEKTFIQAVI